MTTDRRLANITGPAVRGLYYPPLQIYKKNLRENTANSQG